jgi:transcriptional regulator with XRE-family HTH domain
MIDPDSKGYLLVKLRSILKLTQKAFAKKIGSTRGMIIRYEKGTTPLPLDNKKLTDLFKKHGLEYLKKENNDNVAKITHSKKELSNIAIIKMLDPFSNEERRSVVDFIYGISLRRLNEQVEIAKDLGDD